MRSVKGLLHSLNFPGNLSLSKFFFLVVVDVFECSVKSDHVCQVTISLQESFIFPRDFWVLSPLDF